WTARIDFRNACHSAGFGAPMKGGGKKQTFPPKWYFAMRSAHKESGSSETRAVLPAVTARPARGPPPTRQPRSIDRKVVLPDFHWLVSSVMNLLARKPYQTQSRPGRSFFGTSLSQMGCVKTTSDMAVLLRSKVS